MNHEEMQRRVLRGRAADMPLTNAASDTLYRAYGMHPVAGHYRTVKVEAGLLAMQEGKTQIAKVHVERAINAYVRKG